MRAVEPLLYARSQMGLSLAFHIVFAAAGIALPALLVMSEVMHRRTKDPEYAELARRLAKGTAILFAVGAVSGTVLSFELGLLWPQFMGTFGEVMGLPFALEGYAFFVEAIFIGIYLYGRGKVSPRMHLFSAIAVAVSGAASAFFVTLVNTIMNVPRGFEWADGKVVNVDPLGAMFGGAWLQQVVHVLISSYLSIGIAMAGIHAWMMLRGSHTSFHRKALGLALAMACVTAIAQPLSGDASAKEVARYQPVKLAAMESLHQTQTRAPLHLGGWPDQQTGELKWAIAIPGALSFLAFSDLDAEVKGLEEFPKDQWPPLAGTHLSFQIMVGAGTLMALLAVLTIFAAWRKREVLQRRWFLWAVVLASPLGLIALEAGWFVTELGRQPWVVRGFMRTAEAVTPFPYLAAPFWIFTLVYAFLGVIVIVLLKKQVVETRAEVRGEVADAH